MKRHFPQGHQSLQDSDVHAIFLILSKHCDFLDHDVLSESRLSLCADK